MNILESTPLLTPNIIPSPHLTSIPHIFHIMQGSTALYKVQREQWANGPSCKIRATHYPVLHVILANSTNHVRAQKLLCYYRFLRKLCVNISNLTTKLKENVLPTVRNIRLPCTQLNTQLSEKRKIALLFDVLLTNS